MADPLTIGLVLTGVGGVVSAVGAIQQGQAGASSGRGGFSALAPRALADPAFPGARIRTPLILTTEAANRDAWGRERFGQIGRAHV